MSTSASFEPKLLVVTGSRDLTSLCVETLMGAPTKRVENPDGTHVQVSWPEAERQRALRKLIDQQVNDILTKYPTLTTVYHGGARGFDRMFASVAADHGLHVKVFLPDWERHGKAAGYKRNWAMCFRARDLAEERGFDVLGFAMYPTEPTRGAADCMRAMKHMGFQVWTSELRSDHDIAHEHDKPNARFPDRKDVQGVGGKTCPAGKMGPCGPCPDNVRPVIEERDGKQFIVAYDINLCPWHKPSDPPPDGGGSSEDGRDALLPEGVTLHNLKTGPLPESDTAFYIGRPFARMAGSELANPYRIGRDGSRSEVIDKYGAYLATAMSASDPTDQQKRMRKAMSDIAAAYCFHGHVELYCWCAPLPCHGEVIACYLEGTHADITAEPDPHEPRVLPLVDTRQLTLT